ncbi:MAG TPA: FHA domain-containing protein [Solirubrobacteraceae bacterium]|nr:FHA domain-containing protein [Solirubrobacteraceae bacterium]
MSTSVARLEVVAGKAVGMSILVEDELLIGRQTDGAGRLAEDEEISRSHARVTLDTSGFCAIEDLGSTNGTFVNGLRISGPTTVSEGDTIELGATTLAVRELPQPSRVEAPAAGRQATVVPVSSPADEEPAFAGGPAGEAEQASPPTDLSSSAPERVELDEVDAGPAELPPEEAPPALAIRLEVDFAGREARVELDGASEPMRLQFDDGVWRAVSPSAD